MTQEQRTAILTECAILCVDSMLEVRPCEFQYAVYEANRIETVLGVAVWLGKELVCTITRPEQWNAFKVAASIITDGSRTAAQDEYYVSQQKGN